MKTTEIERFLGTIARLRGPDGCPWDRQQSHASLARYLLEESYEVLEAIHLDDPAKLREELGDLLLQIVLNCRIAEESGNFDFEEVAASINSKMIERHPHVFADARAPTAKDVVAQWEELKERKPKQLPGRSRLDGIPKTMPALLQSLKVSERAVSQGFEWESVGRVWDQLESELAEFKQALASDKSSRQREIELELGDILFTLVNMARWENINPEEALLLALDKFKKRFKSMEELSSLPLKSLSKEQWEELWRRAKAIG